MSARVPSCMRAPPDAETMTRALRETRARSAARVIFSPTTLPIDPPMNSKSITTSSTGLAPIAAVPAMAASRSPLFACAAAMRSGYGLLSTKPSGSPETSAPSISMNEPLSTSSSTRARAPMRKWCSHLLHTLRLRASCLLKSISSHVGHFVQRWSGNSFGLRPNGMRNLIVVTRRRSCDVFLTVPAQSDDTGTRTRADHRAGFGEPVFDAVEALLHPFPERERAVGIVRVERARVDPRAGGDALRDELLETRDGLLTRAHAVDRVDDAVLHLEDRLHLQHRSEERLRPRD